MKTLILASIALLTGAGEALAQADFLDGKSVYDTSVPDRQQRYPVKDDAAFIRQAYENVAYVNNSAASTEGVIKTLLFNKRGQPIIEIETDSEMPTPLWAFFPIVMRANSFVKVGAKVRLLGWLVKTGEWNSIIGPELATSNPLVLLSVCIVSSSTLDGIFDKKYVHYCDGWERKIMPPNLSDGR